VQEAVDNKIRPRVDAAGNKIGMGWQEKLKQEKEKKRLFSTRIKT